MKAARCKSILETGLKLCGGGVRGESRGEWGRGGEKRDGVNGMGKMVQTFVDALAESGVALTGGSSSMVLHLQKVEQRRS